MTPAHHAVVAAEDVLLLLRTGRAHMAQWQLAKLPDRIREAIADARAEGWAEGHKCGEGEATASARALGQRQGYEAGFQAGAEAERARPAVTQPRWRAHGLLSAL